MRHPVYIGLLDMNFLMLFLLICICSVPGNGESDTHLDQSNLNTKMSSAEWLVACCILYSLHVIQSATGHWVIVEMHVVELLMYTVS